MDEAKKNDKLSGVNLVSISLKARNIGDTAYAAYWLESVGSGIGFHQRGVERDLRELADLCGFDLVERTAQDDLEDAAVDILLGDAARRAREMNAELPDETLAVLKLKGMVS